MTPKECFVHGTNIRTARNCNEPELKKLLIARILDLVMFLDLNKTLEGEGQVIFTVEAIFDECPSLSIEEIILVLDRMKKGQYSKNGKYFERLKTPEIINALKQYESEDRATMLEDYNTRFKKKEMCRIPTPENAISPNHQEYLNAMRVEVNKSSRKNIQNKIDLAQKKAEEFKKRHISLHKEEEHIEFKRICDKINNEEVTTIDESKFLKKYGVNI